MTDHIVLRVIGKLMIPLILLYGLYVQAHGDFGPGGGFQAGVIAGAAVILYTLVFGLAAGRRIARPALVETLTAVGVLLYGGTGVAAMLRGGNFLDYGALDSHDPVHGQHLGILLIELGVGMTVASVMIMIFFTFAGRPSSE